MPARPAQTATGSATSDTLRAKALEIHRRLCRVYGCPIAYFHNLDPLSELVSSLLSHRTRNADSGRAFKELRTRFPNWAAVAAAPEPAVRDRHRRRALAGTKGAAHSGNTARRARRPR